MKYTFIILFFSLLMVSVVGCSDDSTSTDLEADGLALRLNNLGDDRLEIDHSGNRIVFCYKGEGCEDFNPGGNFSFTGPSAEWQRSDSEKVAVGVVVSFDVIEGEGTIDVMSGESFVDEHGFPDFNKDKIVHSSGHFKEGDTISFTYGDTD